MATFKIDGQEYPVKKPKGMHGVRAVNFVMKHFQGGREQNTVEFIGAMLDDEQFWGQHLPHLLGVSKDVIDEIDYAEVLSAVLVVVSSIVEGFQLPEVEAALGNSASTPEAEPA